MVNKYDFNYLFVEAVGGYFGLAFPLFSSGISHISKRLLFKFIHYAVADKRRAVFHSFCAYLHSVWAYFRPSCGMPGQLNRNFRVCLGVENIMTNHHPMCLPLPLGSSVVHLVLCCHWQLQRQNLLLSQAILPPQKLFNCLLQLKSLYRTPSKVQVLPSFLIHPNVVTKCQNTCFSWKILFQNVNTSVNLCKNLVPRLWLPLLGAFVGGFL